MNRKEVKWHYIHAYKALLYDYSSNSSLLDGVCVVVIVNVIFFSSVLLCHFFLFFWSSIIISWNLFTFLYDQPIKWSPKTIMFKHFFSLVSVYYLRELCLYFLGVHFMLFILHLTSFEWISFCVSFYLALEWYVMVWYGMCRRRAMFKCLIWISFLLINYAKVSAFRANLASPQLRSQEKASNMIYVNEYTKTVDGIVWRYTETSTELAVTLNVFALCAFFCLVLV